MSNSPTFLLATNKEAAPDVDYILHTGRPAFLAQVYKFDSEEQRAEFGANYMAQCEAAGVPCLGSQSRKPWNNAHYFFAVISIFEGIEPTEKQANKLARLTRRMADWYLYNVLQNK